MTPAALIILAFWSGMAQVDHPTPAQLTENCRVTFLAFRDVTVERKTEAERQHLRDAYGVELAPYGLHHLATVRCEANGAVTWSEYDVWQDGRRVEVRPRVTRNQRTKEGDVN